MLTWIVLGVVVGLYALVCLLAFLFQSRLIFIGANPVHFHSADGESVVSQFEIDGLTLSGYHFRDEHAPNKGAVVYFGGNAEEIGQSVRELRATGFQHVLGYNYRGYALSQGNPSERVVVADAIEIIGRAKNLLGQGGRVLVVGRSLGAGVAVQAIKSVDVDGLVLVTPFSSLPRIAARAFPFLPVCILLSHRFNSEEHAASLAVPCLFVIAECDEVIPRQDTERLMSAWLAKNESFVLSGASHNTVDLGGEVSQKIGHFFSSLS